MMQSPTLMTIMKMVETLPEEAQKHLAEHLREYITELHDEARWDYLFANSQDKLEEMARRVKKDRAEGKTRPMNLDEL